MEQSVSFFSSYIDFVALAWFLICFIGYTNYSRFKAKKVPCLSNTLDLYREDWMRIMMRRENRISDASVVGGLERNGAFFASSCLLILAGILTSLGYTNQAMEVFRDFPFSSVPTREIWELRMAVLLALFVYAFFKFTWSMRLYAMVAVMIGSAPLPGDPKVSPAEREALAINSGRICNQAGDSFNLGLRTFYYALAIISWFINPVFFMLTSAFVVHVLYRREFKSDAMKTLSMGKTFEDPQEKKSSAKKEAGGE